MAKLRHSAAAAHSATAAHAAAHSAAAATAHRPGAAHACAALGYVEKSLAHGMANRDRIVSRSSTFEKAPGLVPLCENWQNICHNSLPMTS